MPRTKINPSSTGKINPFGSLAGLAAGFGASVKKIAENPTPTAEIKAKTSNITPVRDLNFWEKFDRKLFRGYLPGGVTPKESQSLDASGTKDIDDARTETFKKEYQQILGHPKYDHFADRFAKEKNALMKEFGDIEGKKIADEIEKRRGEIMSGRQYGGDTGRIVPDPQSVRYNPGSAFSLAEDEVMDEYIRGVMGGEKFDPKVSFRRKASNAWRSWGQRQIDLFDAIKNESDDPVKGFIRATAETGKGAQEEFLKNLGRLGVGATGLLEGVAKGGAKVSEVLGFDRAESYFKNVDDAFDPVQQKALESEILKPKETPFAGVGTLASYTIPYGAASNITLGAMSRVAPQVVIKYPGLTGIFAEAISAIPISGSLSMGHNRDPKDFKTDITLDIATAVFGIFGMKQFARGLEDLDQVSRQLAYETMDMAARMGDTDLARTTAESLSKVKYGTEKGLKQIQEIQQSIMKKADEFEFYYDPNSLGTFGGNAGIRKKGVKVDDTDTKRTEVINSQTLKSLQDDFQGKFGKEFDDDIIPRTDEEYRKFEEKYELEEGDAKKFFEENENAIAITKQVDESANAVDEVAEGVGVKAESGIDDKGVSTIKPQDELSTGPSTSDLSLSQIASGETPVTPLQGIEALRYQDEIFNYLSDQFQELGRKVTPDSLAQNFQRLRSEGRIESVDDFLSKVEQQLENQRLKIQADTEAATKAEAGGVIVNPEIKDTLDQMVEDGAIKLAKEMGWKGRTTKDAFDFIEKQDYTRIKGFDERLGFDPDSPENLIDAQDAWEYLKEGLRKKIYPEPKDGKPRTPSMVISERQLMQKKIGAFNRGYRAGKSTTKNTLEEIKKEISRYARENIPNFETRKSEMTKVMTQIAKAKNLKDINKAYEIVDDIVTSATKRKLTKDIFKQVKKTAPKKDRNTKILKGKYDADTQKVLDDIKNTIESKKTRAEAQDEIFKIMEEVETTGEFTPEQALKVEILKMADIKAQDVEQLKHTLDTIKEVKANGRSNYMAKVEKRTEVNAKNSEEAVEALTGGAGLKQVEPGKPDPNPGLFEKLSDAVTTKQQGWTTLWEQLSKFKKSKAKITERLQTDSLHRIFSNPVNKARQVQNAGTKKSMGAIQEGFAGVFDAKIGSRKFRKAFESMKKDVVIRKAGYKNAEGEVMKSDLVMTRDELIKKYMEMSDPSLDETFTQAMKWTEETKQAVIDNMRPEDIKWAEWQMDFYREYYQTVNSVYRELYGVDLPFNENYSPIKRAIDKDVPEDNLLAKQAQSYASMVNGSLKSRVKNLSPLKYIGANDTLFQHVAQMEHFKAFSEPMRDMRSVMRNSDVREALRQYHGPEALKYVDKFMDDIAKDGVDKAFTMGFVDKLRVNFVKHAIGVNPVVFVKQLTSIPAYWAETPIHEWTGGMAKFWTNPKKHWKELYDNSPMLQSRYDTGFERDIRLAQADDPAHLARTTNALMFPTKAGDRVAIELGGFPMYATRKKKYLKEGLSEDEAIKKAITDFENATLRAQQASDIESMMSLQRSGSFGKALTMFITSPNQYYREATMALRNLRHGRGSTTENIKQLFIYWIVLPSVFQAAADGLEYNPKNQARAMALGPLNGIAVAGQLITGAAGWIVGDSDFGIDISPILSTLQTSQYAIQKSKKVFEGWANTGEVEMEDIYKALRHWTNVGGALSGLPTRTFFRTGEGAVDISEGKTDDYRRLFYSEYALGYSDDKRNDAFKDGNLEDAKKFHEQAVKSGDVSEDFQNYYKRSVKETWGIPSVKRSISKMSEGEKDGIRRALTKLQQDKGDHWVKLFIASYKGKKEREAYETLSKLPLEPEKRGFFPKIKRDKKDIKNIRSEFNAMTRDDQIKMIRKLQNLGMTKEQVKEKLQIGE